MDLNSHNKLYVEQRIKEMNLGSKEAEEFLRSWLATVGEKAPKHSLAKIWLFVIDEIWKDYR